MRGFDPSDHDFYDRDDLSREMDRIFDICHGCRLCFNLCPSFPAIFDAIDDRDLDPEHLPEEVKWEAVDLCYNCKLCYPKCPYTPPHKYDLDFPALMLRAKAVKAKHHGVTLSDSFLGNPVLVGKIGGVSARMTNLANRPGAPTRHLLGLAVGIEPNRKVPPIAPEPFEKWFARRGPSRARGNEKGVVALFHTCSLNYNWPAAARALVEVLEHNGFRVTVPRQRCCGMPALDGGDVDTAKTWARENLDSLHEAVADGAHLVIPGPSCSMMVKHDWPTLLREARADEVAANAMDACEFLMKVHKQGDLDTTFTWHPEKVAYHLPCHLKVQNMGFPGRDLLALTGATVELVDKCSGMDGTWGMKKPYFEMSMKQAGKLGRGLEGAGAELFASDCPLAALQVEELGKARPLHPVEVLHKAYGLAGRAG